MAATLKSRLGTVEAEIFRNWNDVPFSQIKAANITLCNTTGSAVDVWLSFCVLSGFFSEGVVLSETAVPANDTITIEITERIINMDNSIRAYASVADAVTLSIDLLGDITQSDVDVIYAP